jgi:tetratricopeptide (TPR) repeat protein
MQFCFEEGGEDVLQRTLPQVAAGVDARAALAQAAGFPDGDALFAAWRTWIEGQPLHGKQIAQMPTVLDGGDEMEADPVLADRQDLARFVTLGDLLHKGGFAEASLVEYAKAIPNDQPPPPLVTNRIARVRMELGDSRSAKAMLEESLADFPEFAGTHTTLGEIDLAAGRATDALASFEAAVAINPFDADAQGGAVRAAMAAGDAKAAAEHERALRIRSRGGDDVTRVPIHTRTGTYELPSRDDRLAPPEE